MVTWLLLGTALYVLTFFTPALFLLSKLGLGSYLGPRDEEPMANVMHGRAVRANRNFNENYPVFMGLGILALVVPEANMALATTGAAVFVLARLAFFVLYLTGIPVVRSAAYLTGFAGLLAIAFSLL